jgi:hypothetical protein
MSLIKKSDVKNHLSSKRHKNLLSFMKASQPIHADSPGSQPSKLKCDTSVPRQESGLGFYAVTPTVPVVLTGSSNPTDEPTVKKPRA